MALRKKKVLCYTALHTINNDVYYSICFEWAITCFANSAKLIKFFTINNKMFGNPETRKDH